MGHTWKNVSHLKTGKKKKKWILLEKNCHTLKNESHSVKWVLLEKTKHGKWVTV